MQQDQPSVEPILVASTPNTSYSDKSPSHSQQHRNGSEALDSVVSEERERTKKLKECLLKLKHTTTVVPRGQCTIGTEEIG